MNMNKVLKATMMVASTVNAEAIGPLCSYANPCVDTTKCCAVHVDTYI